MQLGAEIWIDTNRPKEELYNALWILCGEQDDVYEQVCMDNYFEPIMEEIHKLNIKLSDIAQWIRRNTFWKRRFTAVSQRIQRLIAHWIMAAWRLRKWRRRLSWQAVSSYTKKWTAWILESTADHEVRKENWYGKRWKKSRRKDLYFRYAWYGLWVGKSWRQKCMVKA